MSPSRDQSGWEANREKLVIGLAFPSRTRMISMREPVSSPSSNLVRSTVRRLPSGDQRARSMSVGRVDRATTRTLLVARLMTRIESPLGGSNVGAGFALKYVKAMDLPSGDHAG